MFKIFMNEAGDPPAGGAPPPAAAPVATPPPSIVEAPPANVAVTPPPAAATSWLESLPEDIKKDPSLAMFKEPAALAKSWVNAQKMIGADKVVIPGPNASDEEKAAFYNKIGRPESADKYELKAPEGYKLDDAASKAFKEAAYSMGMTPAQLNGVLAFDAERQKQATQAAETASQNALRESLKTYAEKLGGDEPYKARVDQARQAVRDLATPELKEFLTKSGLGSHPDMIEHFAQLHKMMGEGKVRDGTGVPFANEDPVAIQKEIEAIETKMFSDLNNPNKSTWVEQRSKLYDRLANLRNG